MEEIEFSIRIWSLIPWDFWTQLENSRDECDIASAPSIKKLKIAQEILKVKLSALYSYDRLTEIVVDLAFVCNGCGIVLFESNIRMQCPTVTL